VLLVLPSDRIADVGQPQQRPGCLDGAGDGHLRDE
jgi:hypothetical protein